MKIKKVILIILKVVILIIISLYSITRIYIHFTTPKPPPSRKDIPKLYKDLLWLQEENNKTRKLDHLGVFEFTFSMGADIFGIVILDGNNFASNLTGYQRGSTLVLLCARVKIPQIKSGLKRHLAQVRLRDGLSLYWNLDQIFQCNYEHSYFGQGYNSMEKAASGYFNKEVKDLSMEEMTILVRIARSPSYYSPACNFDRVIYESEELLMQYQKSIGVPLDTSRLHQVKIAPHKCEGK